MQQTFFDAPEPLSPEAEPDCGSRSTTQKVDLTRVKSKIGQHVLDFCKIVNRREDKQFHAQELHEYVTENHGEIAPNSAYRILWELKRSGHLDYEIINRRQSLYRLTDAGKP